MRWNRASCFARARAEVYGDDVAHAWSILHTDDLSHRVTRAVDDDPLYKQGLERFRVCMRESG